MNQAKAYVVSVDINSGMNGDTGKGALVVQSNLTVTIGFLKVGMLLGEAVQKMDRLVVADIGIRLIREDDFLAHPEEVVFSRSGLSLECPQASRNARSTASRLPVALRSSASAKLYQKWSKTPELRGFRGFSFSNGLTQFDRTKPLLTRFLWVKWWTTTPKRGLMG